MVGLVAARFEQDADANPVPVAWLDAHSHSSEAIPHMVSPLLEISRARG